MKGKHAGQVFKIASAPVQAELSGPYFIDETNTLLLSVQHPGERTKDVNQPTSTWNPDSRGMARSAVIGIEGPLLNKILDGKIL